MKYAYLVFNSVRGECDRRRAAAQATAGAA
jgi:hypothetical protein